MKILLTFLTVILFVWGVILAFADVTVTSQQMQFTGGPEFTVVRTTATMEFTGQ